MDEHLDTSWCPGCDRMVQPKRFTVPASPAADAARPQPPVPAALPPPQSRQSARGKRGTRGGALGLVHGTGRVKLGGGIRRESEETSLSKRTSGPTTRSDAPPAPPPPSPSSPLPLALPNKVRTVISQDQTPLYCSEECRRRDSQRREPIPARFSLKSAPSPAAITSSFTSSLDDMLAPPVARRPSDSSNSTDISSLFDNVAPRHLPDVEEDEVPPSTPNNSKALPTSPAQKIQEALCRPRDQKARSASHEHVPPGWRHYETDWRKIVYGNFDGTRSRRSRSMTPALVSPSSEPAHSAVRGKVDIHSLSPFDRIRKSPAPMPAEKRAQLDLLSKMQFVRTPSSGGLSSSRSSLAHPRGSTSSVCSAKPPSLSRSNSRSAESCFEDDASDSEPLEPPTFSHPLASAHGLSSLSLSHKRNDPLALAMAAKHKQDRRCKLEARRIEERDREIEECRQLRSQGIQPDSWQDHVKVAGPIMGRRAAGLSSAPDGHSWSYEQLPSNIPLYPMPGFPPCRKEKRVQRVEDTDGNWREVEVEVEIAEPRQRLFIFGGTTTRRHSTLSMSSAQ